MPAIVRYPLDTTGSNVNNVVIGEIHTLSFRDIRALVPTYGPFFTEGLNLYDNITNRQLVRNVDYKCAELLQDATSKYGKEISQLILIINSTVSSTVRVNYHVLGGAFQSNFAAIKDMYDTLLNDNRDISWENIVDKPYGYPPSLHNHILGDVVGFEPVVAALERVRNAVVLSDVPIFEAIMDWVKGRTLDKATYLDIDNQARVNKVITLDTLIYSLNKLNFNSLTLTPRVTTVTDSSTIPFKVITTNTYDGTVLFWTVEHFGTTNLDFSLTAGTFGINSNQGSFSLSTSTGASLSAIKKFKVHIRANGITGPILASTSLITYDKQSQASLIDYFNSCCLFNPSIDISPESMFITGNL